jgi:hypothetical protein
VADGDLAASLLLFGSVALPVNAFGSNTATNTDTLLDQLRTVNGRNASYNSFTVNPVLQLEGNSVDVANIRGIVFGPGLPSRKESLGGVRSPYIATNGIVQLKFSNIYIRGNTTITSTGMGVANAVPGSEEAHYGSASVSAPWTWRQHHHTFLGPIDEGIVSINEIGGAAFYQQTGSVRSRSWYKNANTFLPNHIFLTDSTGAEPVNNNDGPFCDQFIHAKNGINVLSAFRQAQAQESSGDITEGFVGRFGSNGYNSVKARGILLGNQGFADEERGATVVLGPNTRLSFTGAGSQFTIFKVAGKTKDQAGEIIPKFAQGTATFGEPNPVGAVDRKYNPVITDSAMNQADGTFALNMGLRSYVRGISPEHGFNITPNVVL